jgi:very-short-patch-repair endonuclease
MGQKKINSTKVDECGKVIKAVLSEWRKENPGALVFDSRHEWNVWMLLKESGLSFELKPKPLILVPKQVHRELRLPEDAEKALRINKRDAVCSADKAMYTRLANKANRRVPRETKIHPVTWSVDFMLPDHKIYLEAKGHPNDAFPIKLKMAQYQLSERGWEVFTAYTKKEAEDLIFFLKNV